MALLLRANASAACTSIARGSVTRTATRVTIIRAPMPPGRKAAMIARSASSSVASPSALSSPTGHRSDDIWLQEKLDEALAGLETSTRRAKVRALRVLHVSSARMSYSPKTLRPRCTALDLDLLWEAQPVSKAGGGPAAPLQGMARVKLSTRDYAQVQVTDVQVLDRDADADGAPSMPSGQAVPPDVLLAVQALDGAIMARFNEFLWAMEQAQAGTFPLASFELDEEHHDDEQLPRFDPGVYATGA